MHLVLYIIVYNLFNNNNSVLEFYTGKAELALFTVLGGIFVSLFSYILSFVGIGKIIISLRKERSVDYRIVLCVVINIAIIIFALNDPSSLYNFHT